LVVSGFAGAGRSSGAQITGPADGPLTIDGSVSELTDNGSGTLVIAMAPTGHVDGRQLKIKVPANQRTLTILPSYPPARGDAINNATDQIYVLDQVFGVTFCTVLTATQAPAPTITAIVIGPELAQAIVVFSEPVFVRSTTGLSQTGTTNPITGIASGNGTTAVAFALTNPVANGDTFSLVVGAGNQITDLSGQHGLAPTTVGATNIFTLITTGWWQSGQGVTKSGANVTAWADQTLSDPTHKNAANVGTIPFVASDSDNGQPSIGPFPNEGDLVTGTWTVPQTEPYTTVTIGYDGGGVGQAIGAYYMSGGAAGNLSATTISTIDYLMAAASYIDSGIVALANHIHIFICTFNGASSTIRVDAKTPAATGNDAGGTLTALTFGNFHPPTGFNQGLHGNLFFVGVTPGVMSASNVALIMLWSAALYGTGNGA
jgi:hypothetical protein